MNNLHHRYTVIVKTYPTDDKYHNSVGKVFKKWRTSDLYKLCKWLDTAYPKWTFFNVYGNRSRVKLGYYSQRNRPQTANPFNLVREPKLNHKNKRKKKK